MPLIVSSPSTVPEAPRHETADDRYLASGCVSTSKRSAERRWSSRWRSPDETDAMSIVTSSRESSGRSTTVTSPVTPVKRPRTLVSMKWRPTKATSACPGSIAHRPAAGSSVPAIERVAVSAMVIVTLLKVCANARNYTDACTRTQVPVSIATVGDVDQFRTWRALLLAQDAVVRAIEEQLSRAGVIDLSSYDVLLELNAATDRRLRM